MKSNVVIISGIWNFLLALAFIYPPFYHTLAVDLQQPSWGWLISAFLLYTAMVLIIGGNDVKRYGSIIVYEALLRFIAASILIHAGLFLNYGLILVLGGCVDILWGISYFIIIPRATQLSIKSLLLNKN